VSVNAEPIRIGVIRMVLADDEQLVREGLRLILELQPDMVVVGEAADGAAALQLVEHLRPDVLLLDVRMPGMDGLEVLERLTGSGVRVLVLTTYDTDELVYRALRAGAGGFLLKDVPRSQLLHAVRVVAAGDELLSPAITRRLVERFLAPARVSADLDRLTERETAVLRLVGCGLSNKEIAAAQFVSEATVKTHLAHVFTKLGLRDRAQAVVVAYETGLVRARQ
jgi:DNA-binding NarL/FixJ family response regulator